MQIPGASRRAEHVRPILDHASCDPPLRADRPRQRAFRDVPAGTISLPDSTLGVASATGADPPVRATAFTLAVPDGRPHGEDGRRSLGALLRNTREQCTNLS